MTQVPTIECNGFIMREMRLSDAESISQHANNPNVKRFLTDVFPHPYTVQDYIDFYNLGDKAAKLRFIIEIDGQAGGLFSLSIKDGMESKSAEAGCWLGEAFWGRGIMSDAFRRIIQYGFENYPLNKIYAYAFGFNTASQRMIEKSGLKKAFVFKEHAWVENKLTDLHYYELFRKDYETRNKL